jgi:hypothetical protein
LGGSLYVLSWGLNLAKPNTYFWDDWAMFYSRPKSYLNDYKVASGRPPWDGVIDGELIGVGPWTLRVLTFAMMFVAAWFAFRLVESIGLLQPTELRLFALVFLTLPTFAARIALNIFAYTTSWFLFLGAWWLVVHLRSWRGCVVALPLFVWSFMTHSLLIFVIVPVAHLLWLGFNEPQGERRRVLFGMSGTLTLLPVLYLLARSVWWAPSPEWVGYHQATKEGFVRGSIPILLCLAVLGYMLWRTRRHRLSAFERSVVLTASGSLLFFLGLFPYVLNQNYGTWIGVFALRSDWGNRHQLLVPLGAALLVVGVVSIARRVVVGWVILAGFVGLNIFTSIQFLLQAIKQEQIRYVVGSEIPSDLNRTRIFLIDTTKRFNGKHSTYRSYEIEGLLSQAGVVRFSLVQGVCTEDDDVRPLYIESDRSFLHAAFTLDPGISVRLGECPGSG